MTQALPLLLLSALTLGGGTFFEPGPPARFSPS